MHEHRIDHLQIIEPTLTDEEQPVLQRAFDRMPDALRERLSSCSHSPHCATVALRAALGRDQDGRLVLLGDPDLPVGTTVTLNTQSSEAFQ